MEQFIRPYQFNIVKNELARLLQVVYFVGDYRVYATTKLMVVDKIMSLFPDISSDQASLFKGIEDIKGQKELNACLDHLKPYVIPFPRLTLDEVKKLFKKDKRFSPPDLGQIEWTHLIYLGWRDVKTHSIYFVYPYLGEMVGVKSKYLACDDTKQGTCSLCHGALKGSEVGLLVARTRSAAYKSVGNYMCLDSNACNQRLKAVEPLESFLTKVMSTR
ncbi:FusB/FusC family EF-G-binding protein [Alicyclobacillus fodiniaquatilis]|uniref:FusB/FusC family EF-G-binding protein n=1 Tax=Alicyclobacillus fodiniaquatilis TaxID=1661150 RepID=A0ABW4JF66_9BACL